MEITNKLYLLILLSLAAFCACKKHDPAPGSYNSPGNNILPTTKKLTRVGDSTNNNQFQYDAGANLSQLNIVTDSNPSLYTISYINGLPAKLQSQYFSMNLNYSAGHLIRTEITNNVTNNIESMQLLTYTNDQVTEAVHYVKSVSSVQLIPQLKFDYEVAPGGDITKAFIYLWDAATNQFIYEGRNEYQYDTHANPVYPLKNFFSFSDSFPATPHNILTENSYDASGTLIAVITYQYTYDGDGDPLKAKRIYQLPGRWQEVSTITYSYQ